MATGKRLQDESHERRGRSVIIAIVCSLFFAVLLVALYRLQIRDAETNIRLSNENSMRESIVLPPRGRILDRNGLELARNRPSYSICVLPYKLRNRDAVIQSLCKIRDTDGTAVFDSASLAQQFRRANSRRFDLTRIREDVSIELVSIIEERYIELPGIVVETESRREYPYGAATFHAVGYMGEIPEKEFDTLRNQDYYWGDLMGRAGLERYYESVMRGKCGREYQEVNAFGKSMGAVSHIQRIEPVYGNDLYLSLDINLQLAVQKAFPDSLKGAVVALDPRSGDVLVMYSNPSVDPNIFSAATSVKGRTWAAVASDRNLPLNNRAIAGVYPPGSTFKPLTGIAGLSTGKITRDTRMSATCGGSYRFGSRVAKCHKPPPGHGTTNYIMANQWSCNVYFYQLGLMLDDDNINKYARMFGLGALTGIDLPGERMGYLSGEAAYNERFANRGWRWTRGLVMDLAIGQQQVLTPLQLAVMVGGMGNSKEIYRPHLVKEERNKEGILVSQSKDSVIGKLALNQYTIDVTHEALSAVVKPGGTGTRAAVPGITVGGKTGSAQNPHGDKTHAVFIACAPVDDPVISVAVVVENAGGGGAMAAPVAGVLLKQFFSENESGKAVYAKLNPDSPPLSLRLAQESRQAAAWAARQRAEQRALAEEDAGASQLYQGRREGNQ
ncbi:MAG: penicillin-binding protein 2 [Chitinispirillia bacterium]|nr:penicillin-binding protein 2 [Chitinispirillia bacterium]MCL2268928.1 penicillin-binding protein 2 [Chitinispirillia bacterium]